MSTIDNTILLTATCLSNAAVLASTFEQNALDPAPQVRAMLTGDLTTISRVSHGLDSLALRFGSGEDVRARIGQMLRKIPDEGLATLCAELEIDVAAAIETGGMKAVEGRALVHVPEGERGGKARREPRKIVGVGVESAGKSGIFLHPLVEEGNRVPLRLQDDFLRGLRAAYDDACAALVRHYSQQLMDAARAHLEGLISGMIGASEELRRSVVTFLHKGGVPAAKAYVDKLLSDAFLGYSGKIPSPPTNIPDTATLEVEKPREKGERPTFDTTDRLFSETDLRQIMESLEMLRAIFHSRSETHADTRRIYEEIVAANPGIFSADALREAVGTAWAILNRGVYDKSGLISLFQDLVTWGVISEDVLTKPKDIKFVEVEMPKGHPIVVEGAADPLVSYLSSETLITDAQAYSRLPEQIGDIFSRFLSVYESHGWRGLPRDLRLPLSTIQRTMPDHPVEAVPMVIRFRATLLERNGIDILQSFGNHTFDSLKERVKGLIGEGKLAEAMAVVVFSEKTVARLRNLLVLYQEVSDALQLKGERAAQARHTELHAELMRVGDLEGAKKLSLDVKHQMNPLNDRVKVRMQATISRAVGGLRIVRDSLSVLIPMDDPAERERLARALPPMKEVLQEGPTTLGQLKKFMASRALPMPGQPGVKFLKA